MAALQQMQPGDAPGVLKKIQEEFRPEKTPNREWEAFLHRWGEIAPAESLAYAMQRDTPNSQGYFLKHFLEGWARGDCSAAAKWLNEHPTVPEWEAAFGGLLRGMASKDPLGATKTALASISDDAGWLRDNAAGYLAAAIMRQGGSDELQKWFASLPAQTKGEVEFKKKAMYSVAQHLDFQDSKIARQWLLAQPSEPWRSEAAYHLVAMKWGKEDPAAALTWLSELATGKVPVRPGAGRQIFQEWSMKKPGEAEQWAKSANNPPFLQFLASAKEPAKQPAKLPTTQPPSQQ